ncbi:hypothetical protein GWI33_001472 [Rhynchophorus ferrugineus]|uniref:Uncharacterized protein n=1 Tax=Rhynchophorus ferrugineus TaxID=354439 RepID=A0A834MK34_RHYFE|nr:hypothetical protein GWI33_001472 [Rhynchophorus ferrugineus]
MFVRHFQIKSITWNIEILSDRTHNVVGGVGGLQPPCRPGATITDHHDNRHRCSDDGSRTTGCAGGSGGCPSALGPPVRTTGVVALRNANTITGQSERYPLGKERQTAPLSQQPKAYQHQERYHYSERPPCLSTSTLGNSRYSNTGNTDRYPHGSLERYHAAVYSRTPTPSSERYHTLDKKYHLQQNEALEAATQDTCTIERYTPTERHRRNSKSDIYKIRERSSSSDRKERLQRDHHQGRPQYDTNSQYERYLSIII